MNQEQELREIRNRWDVDDFVIDDNGQSDILTLLEAIDQRDAIIHDLQLDGAESHERIRLAERCEVVNCLRWLGSYWRTGTGITSRG